jgi:hypothetical protein
MPEHPVANPDLEDQQAREMADTLRDLVPTLPGRELAPPEPAAGFVSEQDRVSQLADDLDAIVPLLPLGGMRLHARYLARDLRTEYGLRQR